MLDDLNARPDDPSALSARATACLAQGLAALEARTDAPLRVLGCASVASRVVFELEEAFELGPAGRRFLVSVDADANETLLLPVAARQEDWT
jgi:hypothetical protein